MSNVIISQKSNDYPILLGFLRSTYFYFENFHISSDYREKQSKSLYIMLKIINL